MRKALFAIAGLGLVAALTISATPALAQPPIVFELFCPGQIDIEPEETGGNMVRCFEVPQPTETPIVTLTPTPSNTPTPTPTATATLIPPPPPTAVDTLVPTATATLVPPTAIPTPDCAALSMTHVSGLVNFQITNSGTQTATITQVNLSWAGEARLNGVQFGGVLIKTFSPPASPVVIITEFEGDLSARQLGPGVVKILFLDFDLSLGSVLAITVTVQTDLTCIMTVQV